LVYLYSSSPTFVCLNQNQILMSCRNMIKSKQTKVKTVMNDFDNKKSMNQISTKAQYALNLHVRTEIYIVNSFENCFLSRKRETSKIRITLTYWATELDKCSSNLAHQPREINNWPWKTLHNLLYTRSNPTDLVPIYHAWEELKTETIKSIVSEIVTSVYLKAV